jgi:DNA-binding NtrC family response regulator
VDKAETFKAGDSFLSSQSYDALVTDCLLPDGQGTMLAAKAADRGIPAVLMTGYLYGLSQAYPSVDFSRYTTLEKPVSPEDFLETAEGLLAGS